MTSAPDSEQMLAAAVAHLRAGRLLDAERMARSLCERVPDHARAFHLAGVVAHQLKRADAAALLGRAVAIDPRMAEAHNDRGAILAANGSLSEALASFERAVELKPDYVDARNNLGRALGSAGRFEEATVQFERVLSAAPTSPPAHFNLAAALELMTEFARAEEHYRKAIALRPDFPDAHLRLVVLLQRSGRLQEALAAAERAMAAAPRDAGVRNNLGNVLRALDRRAEAIAQFEAALRIDPASFAAHYNLGMALRGETKIAQARTHFAQAVALKPDFLEAEFAQCFAELPALYASAAEIDERRAAYAGRLATFKAKLERTSVPATFVDAIGAHQPFYLPYQGRNDRELQSQYGAVVCGAMAARYETSTLRRLPPPMSRSASVSSAASSASIRTGRFPSRAGLRCSTGAGFVCSGITPVSNTTVKQKPRRRYAIGSSPDRVRSMPGGMRSPTMHRICCCFQKSGWTGCRRSSRRCALRRSSVRPGGIRSPADFRPSTISSAAT